MNAIDKLIKYWRGKAEIECAVVNGAWKTNTSYMAKWRASVFHECADDLENALKEKGIEGCACNEGTWDFCEVKLIDGKCPICHGGKPATLFIDD